jgi:hypothetical protein
MSIQVVFGYDMAFLSCLEFLPAATGTEQTHFIEGVCNERGNLTASFSLRASPLGMGSSTCSANLAVTNFLCADRIGP